MDSEVIIMNQMLVDSRQFRKLNALRQAMAFLLLRQMERTKL